MGYIRRIVGGWDCGLYSRRTCDPGTGTGLAEQAGAGPGARVRSTGVSPGQVLPGLHTLRPGGPLGPQDLPSPSPCHLYYVFIGAMGLDCRSGRRPAGPGYRVWPGPSPRPCEVQGRRSQHFRLSTVSFTILSRSNGGELDPVTPACCVTVGGGAGGLH